MNAASEVLTPVWQTARFRLLGILPLAFFIARVVEYVWVQKTPSQVLWMCHLANLMLAAGLFLASPTVICISILFIIFGLPPWIFDMFMIKIVTPVSVFSHLGGAVVGLIALAKVRARRWAWLPALALFILVQQICRFATPPDLNVNAAHYAYGPWKNLFSSYWKYWVVITLMIAAGLWIVEFVLVKLFPPIARR